MDLDALIEALRQIGAAITVYKHQAQQVLTGAYNLIAFNPGEPSHAALQQEITLYTHVVATADTALTALAALAALAESGFPQLPTLSVPQAVLDDLATDMTTNNTAIAAMVGPGAVSVSSQVSGERPS